MPNLSKKSNSLIWVVLLILIGSFLRLYQIGSLPGSFSPDEIAQGYTAYSILQTGQDEWGNSNLLSLRSFGDFKLPLQTLLMIPSISLFGLTTFAVRLPAAIIAILSLPLFYLLTQRLFPRSKIIPILGLAMFSLSTWHLPLSRLALEAQIVIFFLLSTLFLYQTKYRWLSLLTYTLGILTYHSATYVFPLLIVVLFVFHRSFRHRFYLIAFISISILTYLYLPNQRSSDIAIFHPTDNWQSVSDQRFLLTQGHLPDTISRLISNKAVYSLKITLHHLVSYLSPQFLVSQGVDETTYGLLPGFGVLGYIVAFGFYFSLLYIIANPQVRLLLICLLVTFIPSALAKGNFPGNRLSLSLPFFLWLSAIGWQSIIQSLPRRFAKVVPVFAILIFLFETFSYLTVYFFSGNVILADGLLYGRQQLFDYLSRQPYQHLYISRTLSQPQAYYLFFNRLDPSIVQSASPSWLEYQQQGKQFLDQLSDYRLPNVTFGDIKTEYLSQPGTITVYTSRDNIYTPYDQAIYHPSPLDPKPIIFIKNNVSASP